MIKMTQLAYLTTTTTNNKYNYVTELQKRELEDRGFIGTASEKTNPNV